MTLNECLWLFSLSVIKCNLANYVILMGIRVRVHWQNVAHTHQKCSPMFIFYFYLFTELLFIQGRFTESELSFSGMPWSQSHLLNGSTGAVGVKGLIQRPSAVVWGWGKQCPSLSPPRSNLPLRQSVLCTPGQRGDEVSVVWCNTSRISCQNENQSCTIWSTQTPIHLNRCTYSKWAQACLFGPTVQNNQNK